MGPITYFLLATTFALRLSHIRAGIEIIFSELCVVVAVVVQVVSGLGVMIVIFDSTSGRTDEESQCKQGNPEFRVHAAGWCLSSKQVQLVESGPVGLFQARLVRCDRCGRSARLCRLCLAVQRVETLGPIESRASSPETTCRDDGTLSLTAWFFRT
jgi:hypothetical protein